MSDSNQDELEQIDRDQALKMLRRAAVNATKATASRDGWMRYAHLFVGVSLRDIAEATGISHMTVKRIIERTPDE
jgi:transposase-like protein